MVSVTFQTTPPGANIFIDSADMFRITPVPIDIAEGSHNYMLRMTGYEDLAGTVTLVAGNYYIVDAIMKETSIAMQQQFNEKLVKLGWVGVVIGAVGIAISLLASAKQRSQ